jgi:serine phosphatase RsbU (regulator of sigma subunit)
MYQKQIAVKYTNEQLEQILAKRDLKIPRTYDFGFIKITQKEMPAGSLSGDYSRVELLPNGDAGVLIADIEGHDYYAAKYLPEFKIICKELYKDINYSSSPEKFLNELEKRLLDFFGYAFFATANYTVFSKDHETGKVLVRSASKGHEPPIVWRKGQADPVGILKINSSPPIGAGIYLLENFSHDQNMLNQGDKLILITDGISEYETPQGILGRHENAELLDVVKYAQWAIFKDSTNVLFNDFQKLKFKHHDDTTILNIEITE